MIMIDWHLIPSMIFCSLGIILVCLAIFQVRRERTQLHIRMSKIEKMMEKLNDS